EVMRKAMIRSSASVMGIPLRAKREPVAGRGRGAGTDPSYPVGPPRIQAVRRRGSSRRPPPVSLALASRDADLDPPRRHLGIFLLADKIDFSSSYICMPGKLAHLVHRRSVPDGIVDGGLPERVDPDAAASQPVGVNSGRAAVLLHEPPGVCRSRCR